jgi:predicted O-methyltransferase YrrM
MAWQYLPGFFDFDWLYSEWAATARPGAVFVELGVYMGRSLAFMGEALRERPDVEIWGVDGWAADQGTSMAGFVAAFAHHAPAILERARLVRCDSARAARLFDEATVDFVYIDADHSYEGCLADIKAWLPKVRPGGILAGHDHSEVHYPGVVRAVREVFGDAATLPGVGPTWVVRL